MSISAPVQVVTGAGATYQVWERESLAKMEGVVSLAARVSSDEQNSSYHVRINARSEALGQLSVQTPVGKWIWSSRADWQKHET